MRLSLQTACRRWSLLAAAMLLSACASLQVDVDVYKGPFAHEPEIQIKQYTAMAISAKPLLEDLYCREKPKANSQEVCENGKYGESLNSNYFKLRFLAEILIMYDDVFRRDSSVEYGFDSLTKDVTYAMARKSRHEISQKEVDEKVGALSEKLILFAQRVLYITNNELMFEAQSVKEPRVAVLQSLGNTILVHANDLQRQTTRNEKHLRQSENELNAVQAAFQPEPTATMDIIVARVQRYGSADAAATGDVISTATPGQRTELAQRQAEVDAYLVNIANLIGAYQTVVAAAPAGLQSSTWSDADQLSIDTDRQAIMDLVYPDQAVPDNDAVAGTLKPLKDWLAREMAAGIVLVPSRSGRLLGFRNYLDVEALRLEAAGIESKGKRRETLERLQAYLKSQIGQATARYDILAKSVQSVKSTIDKQDKEQKDKIARLQEKKANVAKAVEVVIKLRPEVLSEVEKIGTRDPKVITSVLKRKLEELKAAKKEDKDIDLALEIVKSFKPPVTPCTQSSDAGCPTLNTVEVVDNLIASLRAQRVQAIAAGYTEQAQDLLKAINVAYEQRTAMIYLRPASDYLRSVYSSSALQEATEREHRDMLADWMKYLKIDSGKTDGRKELEKIHWQNVNKVSLSGGGFTNYVLAKDDVGNWYVKAYSSDPEAIIKSATSLALFNSGKAINTNLLRRLEVQRQLDDDKDMSSSRRAELQKELSNSSKPGGQAWLKVRDRYAARYQRETNAQAASLLVTLNELQSKTGAVMLKTPNWPAENCPIEQTPPLLEPLNSKYLGPARTKLNKAISNQDDAAKLPDTELAIQSALTAMHLYSSDVPRTVAQSKDTACEAAQRAAGELARSYVRAQITTAAQERKTSIERYEDALSYILDSAGESSTASVATSK